MVLHIKLVFCVYSKCLNGPYVNNKEVSYEYNWLVLVGANGFTLSRVRYGLPGKRCS